MVDRIIRWSLSNRLLVLTAAVLLIAWGGWQSLNTPIDVFPDLTAPAVTIVAEAHGMPPEDVERLVTFPIETSMNGAAGVRRVRSVTGIGISVVTVEFGWGVDIYRARQVIAERLQTTRASLPDDIPPPSSWRRLRRSWAKSSSSPWCPMSTTKWRSNRSPTGHCVAGFLQSLGVAEVIPIGGETRQYQVVADPERLSAYGISLGDLSAAVGAANRNASAGFVTAKRPGIPDSRSGT